MKQILQGVVDFLHGKKGIIGGLIAVTTTYLAGRGVITMSDAVYVTSVLGVLGISADVATVKLGVSADKTMGSSQPEVPLVPPAPPVPGDVAASDK